MTALIEFTDQLTKLFAVYKNEGLIASLPLNLLMLFLLIAMQSAKAQIQKQQDKVKAAIYNPRQFRKE